MLLKEDFVKITSYVFSSLLVLYLLLLLFNQLFDFGFDDILSLNYILFIVLILGILYFFINKNEMLKKDEALRFEKGKKEIREYRMEEYDSILSRNYSWLVYVIGFLGFIIIKLKTYSFGWLSWAISIIAGIFIIVISLIVLDAGKDYETKRCRDSKIVSRGALINRIFVGVCCLIALSFGASIFISLSLLEGFKLIFGFFYILFLPGFILSYILFPFSRYFDTEETNVESKDCGRIMFNWIERGLLSFGLSIAIVPLAVFYLNLAGIKITSLNVFLEVLGIIVISLIILSFRLKLLKRK